MWTKLRFMGAVLRLIKNPLATEEVFKISDLSRNLGDEKGAEAVLSHVREKPTYRKLLDERYLEELPSLEKLLGYRVGTLGRALGEFLKSNGFDVNFYPWEDPTTEMGYLSLRMKQSHDLWHVLTGFQATIPGETGLQAFSAYQTKSPIGALLVAVGLLNALIYHPSEILPTLGEISKGVTLARKSEFYLGIQWTKLLDENLESLRVNFSNYNYTS